MGGIPRTHPSLVILSEQRSRESKDPQLFYVSVSTNLGAPGLPVLENWDTTNLSNSAPNPFLPHLYSQPGGPMPHTFANTLFSDPVKKLQTQHGSRESYERLAKFGAAEQSLGPDETEFI